MGRRTQSVEPRQGLVRATRSPETPPRRAIAWRSVIDDVETLNLRPDQARQARDQLKTANDTVAGRLPETYQWLLVPAQSDPRTPTTLQAIRLTSNDPLATRASKRLRNDDLLVTNLGVNSLKLELDKIPLWRGDHVAIRQLVEDFAATPTYPAHPTSRTITGLCLRLLILAVPPPLAIDGAEVAGA